MAGGVDLHAHTTASDGSLSPTQLVSLAVNCKLRGISVTDHDTLQGLDEAANAAAMVSIEFVPGIEISVEYPGHFHLLGYFFDRNDPTLNARLQYLKDFRSTRNDRMIRRMQELGLSITREDILAESGGNQIGRPHMALALQRKGIVHSTQEAFDLYLATGKPCHVPKEKMTPEEGIQLIRQAGGVPVVAHPATLKMGMDQFEHEMVRLKDQGLGGIECYYSQHTPDQRTLFLGVALKLGLVATGGSDFHGRSKPNIQLGSVIDGAPAPLSILDTLRDAC